MTISVAAMKVKPNIYFFSFSFRLRDACSPPKKNGQYGQQLIFTISGLKILLNPYPRAILCQSFGLHLKEKSSLP